MERMQEYDVKGKKEGDNDNKINIKNNAIIINNLF